MSETKRIRLGANEKIELEIVGDDERVYVLHGAFTTRLEVLMGTRGGEVRATFVYDFAEVVEEGPRPERDARGKKRPAESYRQTPRSEQYDPEPPPRSSWADPSGPFGSDFRRRGGTGDGWPNDMADDGHPKNRAADEENERREAREREERARRRQARAGEARSGPRYESFNDFFGDFARRGREPDWRAILGHPTTLAEAKRAFKKLALERHPDRGGTNEQMVELNAAMAAAERSLR